MNRHLLAPVIALFCPIALLCPVLVAQAAEPHMQDHGAGMESPLLYAVAAELSGSPWGDEPNFKWADLEAWVGGDHHRLKFRSEGEYRDGELDEAETWLLYHRMADDFWNWEVGWREDWQKPTTGYAVFGVNGLAPYHLETDGHVFISQHGVVSARLEQSTDLRITQFWLLEPSWEVNLAAQDDNRQHHGAGLTDFSISLQSRYAVTGKFQPFTELEFSQKTFETYQKHRAAGEDTSDLTFRIGVKFWF